MPFLLAVIGFLLALILILGTGCSRSENPQDPNGGPVTTRQVGSMAREQIERRLQKLESAKAPEPKMGAQCYEVAAPPQRAEYVCPKCGEKTLYAKDDARFVAWELEACRREFQISKRATDLTLSLDESSYCKHCCPDAQTHQLSLTVTYPDGSTHTTASVSHHDLRILRDFLKGELSYETFNEGTSPLKQEIPRLRELLGVAAEQDGQKKQGSN